VCVCVCVCVRARAFTRAHITVLSLLSLDCIFSRGWFSVVQSVTRAQLMQAGILLPLFVFCWFMFKWEHEDLVPIRPHEGEELPANPLGPRMVREAKFLATLEKHLTPSLA
jgi:Ca2+/Na+ antiporter